MSGYRSRHLQECQGGARDKDLLPEASPISRSVEVEFTQRRYSVTVVRRAVDMPRDPALVVLNPDDEVTAETFAAWLDRPQAGEPVDPGISATETLAEARASGEA